MTGTGLLQRARELYGARDYGATAELLQQAEPARRVEQPELGFLLAASWRQVGRAEDALSLAVALADPVARRGTTRLALRRLNLEGMLRFEAGAVDDAEALWRRVLADAATEDDAEYVAHACNNLGVVFTLQTRMDEALGSYERALVAYHQLGERVGIAQAHQNLAITHRECARLEHADEHFESARYHASAAGDERLLGRVETERSLLHARRGDARLADVTARRARSRFELIGDRAGVGEASRALGFVAIATGRHLAAIGPLKHALEIARELGHALLEGETLLGLSVARAAATPAEARAAHSAAEAVFERIGALQWCRAMERWLIESDGPVD